MKKVCKTGPIQKRMAKEILVNRNEVIKEEILENQERNKNEKAHTHPNIICIAPPLKFSELYLKDKLKIIALSNAFQ